MNAATLKIVFRGVRGSYPMPGPTTLRYGGNTTCQEIRAGNRLIIFDAGTGIIGLGRDMEEEGGPREFAVFFSHNHHDHTGGLLYFKPAYNPNTTMHIYGPAETPGSILEALERLSAPAAHPVQLSRMGMNYTTQVVDDGSVVRWAEGQAGPVAASQDMVATPGDVVVRVMKNNRHPLDGVLNFRIEHGGRAYVYATDVEGDDRAGDPCLAEFCRGADLLAHDGQYTDAEYRDRFRGWGHSTVRMAIRTARLAGVPRLAIIHHEPSHTDDQLDVLEREGQQEFPGLFLAREGQAVIL